MNPRIDFLQVSDKAVQAMRALQAYVDGSGLDAKLLHLVKVRASQMNGCANCLDMHTKEARADGESEQRLYCLDAWRETPFYSDKERAALEWTEALTNVTDGHVPDAVFATARKHFSEEELVNLSLAVTTINAWNRLSIAFRTVPGSYQPRARQTGVVRSA